MTRRRSMRSSHWRVRAFGRRAWRRSAGGRPRAARRTGGPSAPCSRTRNRAAARHADPPALHRRTARRKAGRRGRGAVAQASAHPARRGCASGCGPLWLATERWCRCSTCCVQRRCRPRAALRSTFAGLEEDAPYDLLIARGSAGGGDRLRGRLGRGRPAGAPRRMVASGRSRRRRPADLAGRVSRTLRAEDDAAAGTGDASALAAMHDRIRRLLRDRRPSRSR